MDDDSNQIIVDIIYKYGYYAFYGSETREDLYKMFTALVETDIVLAMSVLDQLEETYGDLGKQLADELELRLII